MKIQNTKRCFWHVKFDKILHSLVEYMWGCFCMKIILKRLTKDKKIKKDQKNRKYMQNNYSNIFNEQIKIMEGKEKQFKKEEKDLIKKDLIQKEKERITREYNSFKSPVLSYVMGITGITLTFIIKAFFDALVEKNIFDKVPDPIQSAFYSCAIYIILIIVAYTLIFLNLQVKITCAELCLDVLNELENVEELNKNNPQSVEKDENKIDTILQDTEDIKRFIGIKN